jgi:hypothetical protein
MLMGGDFNGKVGERGARNWEKESGDGKRKKSDDLITLRATKLTSQNTKLLG